MYQRLTQLLGVAPDRDAGQRSHVHLRADGVEVLAKLGARGIDDDVKLDVLMWPIAGFDAGEHEQVCENSGTLIRSRNEVRDVPLAAVVEPSRAVRR